MNVLIPEAWQRGRAIANPQQRRNRVLTHLLGVLPLVIGVGCALLASLSRHA